MKTEARSFLADERQRFVSYVRGLLQNSSDLDAEDIVHDVFIKLMERRELPAPELFGAYVYRSLRNRVIDQIRARKPAAKEDIEELADKNSDIVRSLQTAQGRKALFTCLGELNEIERKMIIANEFEGIPFKDLSAELEMPVNTLLSHKARGLRKLKQLTTELLTTELQSND